MFTPKKRIPKLAVGMLTLTGCGEGNGGDSLSDAVQAFCMKLGRCYAPLYPNIIAQECIDYFNDYIVTYYNIDAACEAAGISYFNCGAALSCQELMAYSNSCDDEYYAIFEICEAAPTF